jgi:glycerol transport system substrate-binding protein
LYAQFTVCKSVSLKKFMVGLTPIRESDLASQAVTDAAPKLGGLIEFYRSPARVAWTPTGTNVPDYPKLAQLWWKHVSSAGSGEKSAQEAMDALAGDIDDILGRLERAGMERCAPVLNKEEDAQVWLARPGSPKPKLDDEDPRGRTVPYEELIDAWRQGRVR